MQTGQQENLESTGHISQPAEGLQRRLDNLISHIPDAVYSSKPDASGTTTFISKRWEEWTGYNREDFHRNHELWAECIHPDDRRDALDDYLRACREKTAYSHQYRIIHKDTGCIRWVKDQGTPCFDPEGNLLCFEGVVTDISQEKEYEEKLRSTRDAWAGIFESISDSVLVLDTGLRILDANKASINFLHMPKEQLLGKHCYELFHGTDHPPASCPHIKLLATKEPCFEEMDVEAFDRIFSVSVSPVFDEHGEIVKTIHIAKDITEQKKAKQALEESEARYRMAFNQAYQFSVLMDIDGIVLEANNLCYNVTNLKREQVVGKHIRDLPWWPEDTQECDAINEDIRLALDGQVAEREVVYIDKLGDLRQAERVIAAIYDANNRPIFLLGQALDITERKHSEKKIKRLAKFPSENPNPVMRIQADGKLTYHNAASSRIMAFSDINLDKRVPENILTIVNNVLGSHECENHEFNCGDDTFLLNFVPICDMHYVNIYGFNITARKKAEKERELLLKDLSRKNEELESIIYVSSHDLRSPLINISGYSSELQILAQAIETEVGNQSQPHSLNQQLETIIHQEIPECLEYISASTTKMRKLLDGLLRLCRIGKTELNLTCVDVDTLLKNVLDSMQYQIHQLHVSIDIKALPACMADAEQLSQVFSNLLDNAIKYRHLDRPLKIEINGNSTDNKAIYRICDNGLGIQSEYRKKIFEIFHRLEPQSGIEGEGLGLTIAKRVMDRMNGEIGVDSEYGQGSTFILTLPAAD